MTFSVTDAMYGQSVVDDLIAEIKRLRAIIGSTETDLRAVLGRVMLSPESRRRDLLDGYVKQEIEDD